MLTGYLMTWLAGCLVTGCPVTRFPDRLVGTILVNRLRVYCLAGNVGACLTGWQAIYLSDIWSTGWLVDWLQGYLVTWLPGYLVAWLLGKLVSWLPGYLINSFTQLPGCLVDFFTS